MTTKRWNSIQLVAAGLLVAIGLVGALGNGMHALVGGCSSPLTCALHGILRRIDGFSALQSPVNSSDNAPIANAATRQAAHVCPICAFLAHYVAASFAAAQPAFQTAPSSCVRLLLTRAVAVDIVDANRPRGPPRRIVTR
jgi:hypothetical protein